MNENEFGTWEEEVGTAAPTVVTNESLRQAQEEMLEAVESSRIAPFAMVQNHTFLCRRIGLVPTRWGQRWAVVFTLEDGTRGHVLIDAGNVPGRDAWLATLAHRTPLKLRGITAPILKGAGRPPQTFVLADDELL